MTIDFWLIKILASTFGETGGNAVSMSIGLGDLLSSELFSVPLAIDITLQMRATRFAPLRYRVAITFTTLAGTNLADLFGRSLGIDYAGGSIALAGLLLAPLVV